MGAFMQDVRGSLQTVRRVRWLLPLAIAVPTATTLAPIALGRVPGVGAVAGLLAPFLLLVLLGWYGTERYVFASDAKGSAPHLADAWPLVQRLAPRYARLGLLVSPAFVPMVVAMVAWGPTDLSARGVVAVTVFVLYAWLTFVTPALVLTNDRARSAISIGTRLLRNAWGDVAPYALVPAAVLAGLTVLPPVAAGVPAFLAITLATTVCRGATTRRYADLVDIDWDHVPATQTTAAHVE